jgi:hypothetical protein
MCMQNFRDFFSNLKYLKENMSNVRKLIIIMITMKHAHRVAHVNIAEELVSSNIFIFFTYELQLSSNSQKPEAIYFKSQKFGGYLKAIITFAGATFCLFFFLISMLKIVPSTV